MYKRQEYRTLVEMLTRHKRIEETVIPYRAIAVDLISRRKVVLDHGPIGMAVQASSAIPGVFAPVEWEDMMLADGYLLDQVPTDVAKSLGADAVSYTHLPFVVTYLAEARAYRRRLPARRRHPEEFGQSLS